MKCRVLSFIDNRPYNLCANQVFFFSTVPNDKNLGPLQLKQAQPLATMFNRLLV